VQRYALPCQRHSEPSSGEQEAKRREEKHFAQHRCDGAELGAVVVSLERHADQPGRHALEEEVAFQVEVVRIPEDRRQQQRPAGGGKQPAQCAGGGQLCRLCWRAGRARSHQCDANGGPEGGGDDIGAIADAAVHCQLKDL